MWLVCITYIIQIFFPHLSSLESLNSLSNYDMCSYDTICLSAGHALQFLQHGWVGLVESSTVGFLGIFHFMFLYLTHRKFHVDAGIHPKDFFVMLRAIPHISSVWHLSFGLQQ